MANRRAAFTQSGLTRIAAAMKNAGVSKYRIVARADGTHEIVVGEGQETETGWEDLK